MEGVASSSDEVAPRHKQRGGSVANEVATTENEVRKSREDQAGLLMPRNNHSADGKYLNSVAKGESSTLAESERDAEGSAGGAHDVVGSSAIKEPQDHHERGDDACAAADLENVNAMQSTATVLELFMNEPDYHRCVKNDTSECRTSRMSALSA
ncbi:hypothetical protein MRX96_006009 [Rhipicephalus microplus]